MEHHHHYAALPTPRSIRIINLEPSVEFSSPLRCHQAVVSLDDYREYNGEYTALSYSWDAQNLSSGIECDDGTLHVTPNCEAALRQLRLPNTNLPLWIDSACISQSLNDLDERNQQVALIGEIFKNARSVIVWVGEGDTRTEAAIQRIMEIGTVLDVSLENRRDIQREIRDRVRTLANQVRNASEDPIQPLFERSWFHRMWTVQEVTLSLLDRVVLRCGNKTLPWTTFFQAVDGLGAENYRWGQWKQAMKLQKQLTIYISVLRYTGVREILDDNAGDIHNEPLVFSILANAREKISTDPKDKIFALNGVFQEMQVPFPAPDYRKPVEEVYRESVVSCISYDNNLYVLYHVPSNNRRDGLLSWVPDWSDQGWAETDPRYALLRDRFAACAHADSRWRFNNRQLIITGKMVDSIVYRAEALPGLDLMGSVAPDGILNRMRNSEVVYLGYSVFKTWVEVSQWSEYPTGESTKEALKRTLVNDNPDRLVGSTASFNHWYEVLTADDLEIMEMILSNIQRFRIPGPGQREAFLRECMSRISEETRTVFALKSGPGALFHYNAIAASQKKTFFYTENGYFGTAPDPMPTAVEAGDKIAVIGGLEMPLLLQPVEGGYRLLTHVYVHGIMHGEAWPENHEDLEEIVLV